MSNKERGKVGASAPAQPTPIPDSQLAELRERHRPWREDPEVCAECFRLWPCTISRLLVNIDTDAEYLEQRSEFVETILDPPDHALERIEQFDTPEPSR